LKGLKLFPAARALRPFAEFSLSITATPTDRREIKRTPGGHSTAQAQVRHRIFARQEGQELTANLYRACRMPVLSGWK